MEMNASARQIREMEEELHTDIVPGTEVMRDVGSYHFVKSGTHVLVPQPSGSPHDPLNWSPLWKTACMSTVTFFVFCQGFGPLSMAPMFPDYMKAFDASLHDVIQFVGYCILVLGFSNFVWVPMATSCGRRPVLLLSQIICLVASIWRARAQSYHSFMGAVVLNGFAAAPAETVPLTVIADIFFLHDRGFWNTVYWVAYMGSLMVGPVVSGAMASRFGWRYFWWLNVGLLGLSTLSLTFLCPETKYHRMRASDVMSSQESLGRETKTPGSVESSRMVLADDWHEPEKTHEMTRVQSPSAPEPTSSGNDHVWIGKGGPCKSQWGVYTASPHAWNAVWQEVFIPWKLFTFPIVQFSAFVISFSCSCFLTVNLTQSQNFAAPPYNWTPGHIGLTNFAVLVGAGIGLATAGPLSDWVSDRATKKNRGIREPEMRLPAMIPYVLIMILGNFVVAFGYQHKWRWEVIVLLGYTCAGIQVAALPAMATTYAIDSYKPVAGSVMVAATVNKNLWGYGLSDFITPWVIKAGYVPPIMLNMSLTTLWCLFAVVMYVYGKQFRRWTKNDRVHRM